MDKRKLKQLSATLSAVAVLALCCGFSVKSKPQSAAKQDGMARIIKQKNNYFLGQEFAAPVSYSLSLNGQPLNTDEPFVASDKFLEDMRMTITNTSNHPISYVSFTFFIVAKDGAPKEKRKYAYPIAFGDTTWATPSKPTKAYPTLLAVGETKTFPLKGNTFTSLDVARKHIDVDGRTFELRLDQVFRTDDIFWQGGVMGKRSSDGTTFKRYHGEGITKAPTTKFSLPTKASSLFAGLGNPLFPTTKASNNAYQSCWKCDDVNVYVACFYPNQDCVVSTPDCEEFELGFNQMCEWGYQACFVPYPESGFCWTYVLVPTFTGCGMPPC